MGLVWPFPTRNPSQEHRTDEGWDLIGPPGGDVLAVAPGTFHMARPNPGGFGNDYPVEHLDTPIMVAGQSFSDVYYGHTHMVVPPGHYDSGVLIAHAGGGPYPLGGSGAVGEVEIGFGDPNVAGGIQYRYGPLMKEALNGAVAGGTVLSPSGPQLAGGSADPTSSLIGSAVTGLIAPYAMRLGFLLFGAGLVLVGLVILLHVSEGTGKVATASKVGTIAKAAVL